MHTETSPVSCGVIQLFDLSRQGSSTHLEGALRALAGVRARFAVFSDADHYGNGIQLANEFRDAGYELIETVPAQNPNTFNTIRVWVVTLK